MKRLETRFRIHTSGLIREPICSLSKYMGFLNLNSMAYLVHTDGTHTWLHLNLQGAVLMMPRGSTTMQLREDISKMEL